MWWFESVAHGSAAELVLRRSLRLVHEQPRFGLLPPRPARAWGRVSLVMLSATRNDTTSAHAVSARLFTRSCLGMAT